MWGCYRGVTGDGLLKGVRLCMLQRRMLHGVLKACYVVCLSFVVVVVIYLNG